MTSLRERQRTEAMGRVQRVAVDAFVAEGFDAVTVERIAADAGVSPVSIYRWFGTKEGLVLWDEYDPPLFEAITSRLVAMDPIVAVREALAAELDQMYEGERAHVLARAKLILAEPALMAASLVGRAQMVSGLEELLAVAFRHLGRLQCRTLAGAIVAVLSAAVEEWANLDGAVPLGELISDGFEAIGSTEWTT